MKLFTIFSLVLSTLLMRMDSCKDPLFDGVNCTGNCYELKGRVTDSATNQGRPYVKLKFYYHSGGYSIFGNSRLLVDAKTNQNGDYSIKFDGTKFKEGKGYFSLSATHSNYFIRPLNDNHVFTLDLDSTSFNKPVQRNFAMHWPGFIKLHLTAGSTSTVKHIDFSYSCGKSGLGYWLPVKPNLDTTISLKTASGIQTNIRWYISPLNGNVQNLDSITVSKIATVEYKVAL